jgi:glycosyltransferase involved in cell wall biosynthesis
MADITIFLMDLSGGGAEKAMLYLANGFSQKGYKVDLVLVQAIGPYLEQIASEVNVVNLKASRLFFSLPKLISYLKSERPTVLLTALEDTNLIALWARLFANVPTRIILSIHNHISLFAQNATRWKHKLTPFLAYLFYPWASEMVAVSKGVAEDLAHITSVPLDKIKVIYNPIITSEFLEQSLKPIDHPWFSQKQKSQIPIILGVGRLEQQKNFDTLIRAFAKVKAHYPFPVRLVILGEGSLRISLEKLTHTLGLSDSIALLGFVDNPYAYMTQASVFVLSSVFEGFGNVLCEAIAAGTPVVSTDCKSGPAEILDGGKYGKLVAVGDVDSMAEAILQTLKHPPDTERLRQRGNQFSVNRAVAEYLQVLQPIEYELPA